MMLHNIKALTRRDYIAISFFPLIIAVFVFFMGINSYPRAIRLQFNSVKTEGIVEKLYTRRDSPITGPNGETILFDALGKNQRRDNISIPLVLFSLSDGKKVEFIPHSVTELYNLNQHVTVLYDPQNPSDAEIGTFEKLWLQPIIISIVFIVCLLLVVFLWRRATKLGHGEIIQ